MNQERIEHKRRVWDEGAWVREAAAAFGERERNRGAA